MLWCRQELLHLFNMYHFFSHMSSSINGLVTESSIALFFLPIDLECRPMFALLLPFVFREVWVDLVLFLEAAMDCSSRPEHMWRSSSLNDKRFVAWLLKFSLAERNRAHRSLPSLSSSVMYDIAPGLLPEPAPAVVHGRRPLPQP